MLTLIMELGAEHLKTNPKSTHISILTQNIF